MMSKGSKEHIRMYKSGYSQSASLLAHNRVAASQLDSVKKQI